MISFTSALYIAEWIARIIALFVVVRKRRPSAALAWLVVIYFQPWIGILLYLLIGRNRLPFRRTRQYTRLLERLEHLKRQFDDHPHTSHPELGPQCKEAIILARHYGSMPILNGNSVTLISDTNEVIDKLIDDINTAQDHVHMLFFIFRDDDTGYRVADSLKKAAKRGIKCRLLLDAVGSWSMLRSIACGLRKVGVEVQDDLPVGFLRRRASRIDLRNHRKIVIIDGKIGYTGSQNIVDDNYGHKDLVWRDLMARMSGPVVQELQTVFLENWNFRTDKLLDEKDIFPPPVLSGDVHAQVLPSGPNFPVESYQRLVVSVLYSARERVIITTPYFIPNEPFLQAMQVVAQRGVEVNLILPGKTDHPLVDMAGHAYFEELLEAGVKIFSYKAGLLHAKTMSVDDSIAFIGSSNFDIRSFSLNFEVNLLLYGRQATGNLRKCQMEYLRDSTDIELSQWQSRSLLKRTSNDIAKLFSPLL
ncbi:MAG: cardiolipin synthase [Sedimentisphaerales bacterium]|nr:cardiolipin synthase [Sedimentisphaerales bacterium]